MDKEKTLKKYVKRLKNKNIRVTSQRVAILKYMIEHRGHPTVQDIFSALKPDYPHMSMATVYNNLKTFVDVGFVMELKFSDESAHFDLAEHMHYHAICENCGKFVDFDYPQMDDVESQAEKLTGFKIDNHRLEVYGICPECQQKMNE